MNSTHDADPHIDDGVADVVDFLAGRDVPCPRCGYNLRDSVTARCPECGRRVGIAALLYTRSRVVRTWARPVAAAAAACIAIGLAVAQAWPSDPFAPVVLIVPAAGLALLGLLIAAGASARPWREPNPRWGVRFFGVLFWIPAAALIAFAAYLWARLLFS